MTKKQHTDEELIAMFLKQGGTMLVAPPKAFAILQSRVVKVVKAKKKEPNHE